MIPRCLHLNDSFYTISALQLPLGKTTVMHLVARENLPEPNNQGMYSTLKKYKFHVVCYTVESAFLACCISKNGPIQ